MSGIEIIWQNLIGVSGPEQEQLNRLAEILEIAPQSVADLLHDRRLSYRCYEIRKRNRKPRQIAEPSGALKLFQRRLLRNHLAQLPVSSAAMAFRRGMSIATHAATHVGQEIAVTADLKDFFPSISTRRVRKWYGEQGWTGVALDCLVRLSTYRGSLPQGAPTSPALSNLVAYQLDLDLTEMTTMTRGRYSRYCDDLAFSWSTDCEPVAWRHRVEERLSREGYAINQEKGWKCQLAEDHPELTGIAIHGSRLKPSQSNRSKIRRLFSRWSFNRHGQQWQGYRGFLKMLQGQRTRRRW